MRGRAGRKKVAEKRVQAGMHGAGVEDLINKPQYMAAALTKEEKADGKTKALLGKTLGLRKKK